MTKKRIYALQPYQVGNKNAKSLAIVIPCDVAKENNVNTSTIFTLLVDSKTKKVILQTIDKISEPHQCDCAIPAGESLEGSSQQVSSSGAQ
jgi:hypothetical protein